MDLQSPQHGKLSSLNQSYPTIHASLSFFSSGSTKMDPQRNQTTSNNLSMGKYGTKLKMGSSEMGYSMSSKKI